MRQLILALLLFTTTPVLAADLTLKRVMLSSAGVGYFEYEADVDGTATLGLDVPLEQVDDVLTSLVVFDSASVSQSIFSLRSDILFVDDHELGILPQQALGANLVTVEPVGGPAMTLLGVIDPSHAVF